MAEKQVPVLDCLDDLVQQLRTVFQSDCVNVDYVRALLDAYKSNTNDWKQYAVFDPYRYIARESKIDIFMFDIVINFSNLYFKVDVKIIINGLKL